MSYAIACGLPVMAAVTIYSVEGLAGLGGRVLFGLALLAMCDEVWCFTAAGCISEGMEAEINEAKNLVRSLPSESAVADWIEHAKTLDKVVTH